jgi:hypothetical protein
MKTVQQKVASTAQTMLMIGAGCALSLSFVLNAIITKKKQAKDSERIRNIEALMTSWIFFDGTPSVWLNCISNLEYYLNS